MPVVLRMIMVHLILFIGLPLVLAEILMKYPDEVFIKFKFFYQMMLFLAEL